MEPYAQMPLVIWQIPPVIWQISIKCKPKPKKNTIFDPKADECLLVSWVCFFFVCFFFGLCSLEICQTTGGIC